MNQSRHNFVTPDEILSDVLKMINDEEFLYNSKGWYMSQIQQALTELSFDTLFDEKVIELDMQANGNVELPKGVFNLIEIFLFNGDLCDISSVQNVWHKRNFFSKGSGFLARNTGQNQRDPFYGGKSWSREDFHSHQAGSKDPANNVISGRVSNRNNYYYNIHNGIIMLSEPCKAFKKIAIIINGTGCEIGDLPIVPEFFREAVKDYLCEVGLRVIMVKAPQMGAIWKIYDRNLNKNETFGPYAGSWYKAKMRIAKMNSHERESLREYLAKAAW